MHLANGDIAIVTGASKGLGVHISRALAGRGVNLVLAARSRAGLEELARELEGLGVETLVAPTDLRDRAALEHLHAQTLERFGAIDVLVNNAGLSEGVRWEHTTLAEIDEMIDVNLRAPLALTHLVWPAMLARARGHVVNIASMAGQLGSAHMEGYCATKHALVGFTRALRLSAQDASSPASASVICPGFMDGDGQYEAMKRDFAVRAPRALGSLDISAIGPAVIRAIEHDMPELMLTPTPQRPAMALHTLAPRLFERLVARSGMSALFRTVADRRLAARGVSVGRNA